MKNKIIILASILGFLAGCSQLAESAPTPFPPDYLPTVVALTGQAALETAQALKPTALFTETAFPTETPVPSTALPTLTPTVEPGFTDFAQVRFISPGPMSSLISPIRLKVLLVSGETELVQVDLLGENGRLLQRILEHVQRNLAGNYRSFDLLFETRAVSEKGYIRISSKDSHGQIQALNTMPVLLYSVGSEQVNPVGNMIYERVMLDNLKDGALITGGEIKLKGRFWPFNNQPLFIDLTLQDGKIASSRVINLQSVDPENFETTLPYKVTEKTLARLSFHQENPDLAFSETDLKTYIYVYTMLLVLNP